MPRYFFHRTDGASDPDHEGVERSDLARVRLEAVRLTAETAKDHPHKV